MFQVTTIPSPVCRRSTQHQIDRRLAEPSTKGVERLVCLQIQQVVVDFGVGEWFAQARVRRQTAKQ